ncbi:MAG: hypothetical protein RJA20_2392 [Bacteroidota bacterium]
MAKNAKPAVSPIQGNSGEFSQSLEKWLPVILAGTAALLFSSGLNNEMVDVDDHSATTNNPAVTRLELFSGFNLGMFAPLTWLGYALCYQLGGENSFWYHFLGLIIHTCNVWLVFRLLRDLGTTLSVAGFVTFFFGIHPLQVEPVAWIAGFSTPLFSLFSLCSLRAYVRHTRSEGVGAGYWHALVFFVLAGLAKSAAAVLPLSLLALDLWMKRPVSRRTILEKVPFFVLALGMGILTLISRKHAGLPDQPADFSVSDRFLMVCQTIVFYWKQILLPGGLSIWYPFVRDNGSWPWSYYASPFILLAVLFAAWRLRGSAPVILAGLVFYLSNIVLSLPFSTFGTFELRSDRYNYLAIIGILLIIASVPDLLRKRRPSLVNAAWGVLCTAGLVFMVKSGLRIRDWQNTLKLIESSMAAAGDNFGKAYLWRGILQAEQGKYPQAVQDFDKAISINSKLYEAYKQRGNLMGPMKKFDQSVADLSVYLSAVPDAAAEYYNRGLSYTNLGKTGEAMADFSKCIELDPAFARAYRARGNTYLKLGETEKGQSDLDRYEALGGGK